MARHGHARQLHPVRGGGLGDRYAGGLPYASWGTDDYLSTTMMGGRNAMCTGPCTRDTVMTYWLQHDITQALARQSFDVHEFVGDNIHRQHTTFAGGKSETWVNRGDEPWTVGGVTLPKYGYLARSGEVVSSITLRDGISVGYAHSPTATFVDARPDFSDYTSRAPVKTHVVSGRYLGDGKCEAEVEFEVLKPLPEGIDVFVHVSHDKAVAQGSERIAIHAPMEISREELRQVGKHTGIIRFTIPADLYDGEYRLRYGLWLPKAGGGRLAPIADMEGSRVRGGVFLVTKETGKIKSVEYKPEKPLAERPQWNAEGKMIAFDGIVTNGAFRLLHSGNEWRLLPLQGSLPLQAEVKLSAFGGKGRQVAAVEGLDQAGKKLTDEKFAQQGDTLSLDLNAEAFSYRITLR